MDGTAIRAMMAEIAPVMREYVASETAPLLQRIAELEARQLPERGQDGLQGERGLPGAEGAAGRDGVSLAGAIIDRSGSLILTLSDGSVRELGVIVGRDGERGETGAVGPAGADGRDGVDGAPGRDGIDGKDGRDGNDGPPGPAGPQGDPGLLGEPGPQGDVGPQGEAGADGADGLNGKDGADAYHGEARGLFDPAATYRALDVVSFNGSEWRAKRDDPGEIPGDGWMLSACRGKKGEPGKGVPGANLVAAYVENDAATLVLTRDDGLEIKADLSGLFQPK